MADLVKITLKDDGVAVVTLADPDRRNALGLEMTRALARAMKELPSSGARVVILNAEPPVFCAGGSLDDLANPRAPLEDMYAGFRAVAECPLPTVAAVDGACIGAGANLPLSCDVILTTPIARFDPRWLDVGIHPGGGNLWSLMNRGGRQMAAALVLFGEVLDGQQAAAHGLAWSCVPSAELDAVAHRLASRVALRDPELVRRTKESLDASQGLSSSAEALALELEPQRWSMQRPAFRATVARAVEKLGRSGS